MSPAWRGVRQAARRIGRCKTAGGRRRAVLAWCRQVRGVLGG